MKHWFAWLLVCCLFVSCGETEKKRRTVGYKGPARGNAFLAAQRLLKLRGYESEIKSGIAGLDEDTALLFLTPSALNTTSRAAAVLKWVKGGGHLALMISNGEKRSNDFRPNTTGWIWKSSEIPGVSHVLDALSVKLVEWQHQTAEDYFSNLKEEKESKETSSSSLTRDEWEALSEEERVLLGLKEVDFSFAGISHRIYLRSNQGLEYEELGVNEYGTGKKKHRCLSLVYGAGRVTIFTDARPLRNRYIGYADHAELLLDLVELSPEGKIVFSDGSGEGLFDLIWRHFWMVVLGAVLTIIFWLWKNLPRFGPQQDIGEGEMREFSGQLRGVGRFLWRQNRDDVMLDALRARVSQKLSLVGNDVDDAAFEQLAQSLDLPVETIREAMKRSEIREPSVMVRVMRTLQLILKQIN